MSGSGGLLVAVASVSVLATAGADRPHWRGPCDPGANGKLFLASDHDDVVAARMGEKVATLTTKR